MRYLLIVALLLACAPAPAFAQTTAEPGELQCLPRQEGGTGTAAIEGWSLNGWWAWWWCPHADGRQRLTIVLGTPATALRALGDRLDTVRNATDKLVAARASWSRHVTLPLDAPELAAVRADWLAHIRATPNLGR